MVRADEPHSANQQLRAERAPSVQRWLYYHKYTVAKETLARVVGDGLQNLLAKTPQFREYACKVFWLADPQTIWNAFCLEYTGFNLVGLRSTMKAAHTEAQLSECDARTTQPPGVTLYRQQPQRAQVFAGTLQELAALL